MTDRDSTFTLYRRGIELLEEADFEQAAGAAGARPRGGRRRSPRCARRWAAPTSAAGRFAAAAVEFEAVVETHQVNDYAHFCLGRALSKTGETRARPPPPGARLEPAPGPARLPLLPRAARAPEPTRAQRPATSWPTLPRAEVGAEGVERVAAVAVAGQPVDRGAVFDQPAAAAGAGRPVAADRHRRRAGDAVGERGRRRRRASRSCCIRARFAGIAEGLEAPGRRLRSVTIVAPPPTASATLRLRRWAR